ncbi:Uncharacterized protein APZ42_009545, partial [Daphnia magna]
SIPVNRKSGTDKEEEISVLGHHTPNVADPSINMDSVVATGSVQSHQTPVVVSENPASTANTTRPHATVVHSRGSVPPRQAAVAVPDLSAVAGAPLVQSFQTSIKVLENPDSIANRTSPRATVVAVLGGCSPSLAPPRHSDVSVPHLANNRDYVVAINSVQSSKTALGFSENPASINDRARPHATVIHSLDLVPPRQAVVAVQDLSAVAAAPLVQSHQTSIIVSENPNSIANRTSTCATVVAVLGNCG